MREFYNNQVNSLVGFTSRVGGDAGEGASVFHSTDEDVQSPVIVDQCSGGVRYQFTLRRNPVDGWFWVTSCLTPKTRQSKHIRGFTSSKTEHYLRVIPQYSSPFILDGTESHPRSQQRTFIVKLLYCAVPRSSNGILL